MVKQKITEYSFDEGVKFRTLIENSTDGILLLSRTGDINYLSPAALKMLGYSKKESIGKSSFSFIHSADRDSIIKIFGKLLLKPKSVMTVTFRVRHKNGNYRYIEAIGKNQLAESALKSIVVNFRDVTDKKIAEERSRFLDRVKSTLSRSLREAPTLQEIVNMSVPFLADYCRMVVLDEKGEVRHTVVSETSVKGGKRLISKLYTQYKSDKSMEYGVPHMLKTGKSELIHDVSLMMSGVRKKNPALVRTIKSINLCSYMGTPLKARGEVIGAITFSSVQPDRLYTQVDLTFAEEIAHYIALSVDNLRLYNEAEEEIEIRRDIEERLELAQSVGKVGVFEIDIPQQRYYWSPELKKMYGIDPDKEIKSNKEWSKMVHPEDRKIVFRQYRKDLKITDYLEYEFRIMLPDGTIKWLYSKSKVFFDNKRNPVRILGVNIDVSRIKRAETNVRFLAEASKILASSLDYEETLNNVAKLAVPEIADWCAVDILDNEGNILRVAIAHKDPKKVKWAWQLWKKDRPTMSQPGGVQNVLKTGKSAFYPLITEEMIKTAAKDEKHLKLIRDLGLTSALMVPLSVEKRVVGVLEFVTTESRKRFTQEDLAMAEELASRASLAIQNARLYQQAQRAVAVRDDFMSVASHELKTPITSLKIFTQILHDHLIRQGADPKALMHLSKMDNQINKIVGLIYDLLDISRIQSGQMDLNIHKVLLDDLIQAALDDLRLGITSHKIILNGRTGVAVLADEDRIIQVIANLVSNAVKYSPNADRVVVTVKKRRDGVRVSVSDFGIGISGIDQQKIFERFFRGGSEGNTFPGLGIGLYVSDQIVKRHNGKLWVESEEGRGSTFHFDLPFKHKKGYLKDKESRSAVSESILPKANAPSL